MSWRKTGRVRDLVLGAGLLLGVAACTWQGIKPEAEHTRRLYISGETAHVTDAKIAAVAAPYLEASFFDVNIQRLQAELSKLAWLTDVSVSRHWPSGVVIHVAEHSAVALWGKAGVLGENGEVFIPDADVRPAGLVRLDGPDTAGLRIYRVYQTLSAELAGADADIAALRLDARGSWTATLAGGLELRLGRDDLKARLQRFVDYALGVASVRQELATAGYVDLRYSDGFALGGRRTAAETDKDQEKVDEQAA